MRGLLLRPRTNMMGSMLPALALWACLLMTTCAKPHVLASTNDALSLSLACSFHHELVELAAECDVEVEYLGVLGAWSRSGLQPVFEDASWQIVRAEELDETLPRRLRTLEDILLKITIVQVKQEQLEGVPFPGHPDLSLCVERPSAVGRLDETIPGLGMSGNRFLDELVRRMSPESAPGRSRD